MVTDSHVEFNSYRYRSLDAIDAVSLRQSDDMDVDVEEGQVLIETR